MSSTDGIKADPLVGASIASLSESAPGAAAEGPMQLARAPVGPANVAKLASTLGLGSPEQRQAFTDAMLLRAKFRREGVPSRPAEPAWNLPVAADDARIVRNAERALALAKVDAMLSVTDATGKPVIFARPVKFEPSVELGAILCTPTTQNLAAIVADPSKEASNADLFALNKALVTRELTPAFLKLAIQTGYTKGARTKQDQLPSDLSARTRLKTVSNAFAEATRWGSDQGKELLKYPTEAKVAREMEALINEIEKALYIQAQIDSEGAPLKDAAKIACKQALEKSEIKGFARKTLQEFLARDPDTNSYRVAIAVWRKLSMEQRVAFFGELSTLQQNDAPLAANEPSVTG